MVEKTCKENKDEKGKENQNRKLMEKGGKGKSKMRWRGGRVEEF